MIYLPTGTWPVASELSGSHRCLGEESSPTPYWDSRGAHILHNFPVLARAHFQVVFMRIDASLHVPPSHANYGSYGLASLDVIDFPSYAMFG